MIDPASETLGLIAGSGRFPLDIARAAAKRGWHVFAIAFHEHADARLGQVVHDMAWVHPGEAATALQALVSSGARRAVMAGKVPKAILFDGKGEGGAALLDEMATGELAGLKDRSDDAILGLVAGQLASSGIELLSQLELVPELVGGVGPLGTRTPTPEQVADITFGWPIAKAIAGLDVGQTIVVKDGAVLAVEAIEGTDDAIARAGRVATGASVVKVAKPHQDPRFDVPAIGLETLRTMIDAGAAALAFEAGRTVVLDRARLAADADLHDIALIGIEPQANEGEAA